MRNHKPLNVPFARFFPHRTDEAFELLGRLEGLLASMRAANGSRFLRERVHRASSRLAELVIVACSDDSLERKAKRYEPGLLLCKIIDGLLHLLTSYGVLTREAHHEAVHLAVRLAKLIARRYLGIEVEEADDSGAGPAPSGAAVPVAEKEPPLDIAANAPPLAAIDVRNRGDSKARC